MIFKTLINRLTTVELYCKCLTDFSFILKKKTTQNKKTQDKVERTRQNTNFGRAELHIS